MSTELAFLVDNKSYNCILCHDIYLLYFHPQYVSDYHLATVVLNKYLWVLSSRITSKFGPRS